MPKLTGKLGEWELPHVHMWKDRAVELKTRHIPLISSRSKVVIIGDCFSEDFAAAMRRLNLDGWLHPNGLFYNTHSIRQEIERVFGGWPGYSKEPLWSVDEGYIHPFKSYYEVHPSLESLQQRSDELDRQADTLFTQADVILVFLGLTEIWRNPKTGNAFRQIPPPQVFNTYDKEFYCLTFQDIFDDLRKIRQTVKDNTKAELIFAVGPISLHSTMTELDVRVANTESKSRIRAAVSEFIYMFPDVHYFPSYEIVTTAENPSDFVLEDGRHVHQPGIDYILQQFLRVFGCEDVSVPTVRNQWLSAPSKTAVRVSKRKVIIRKRLLSLIVWIRKRILFWKHN